MLVIQMVMIISRTISRPLKRPLQASFSNQLTFLCHTDNSTEARFEVVT